MWRLTLSQVLARRFRLAFTLLAVVLGVTFVTGSLVLTDTSQRLFDDQFRSAVAKVDLTVRDAVAFDAAMGVEVDRDPLPAGLTARIAGLDGVRDTRPVAKGQGLIVVDGEPIVPNGPTMLSSWSPAPFGAFVIREGQAPAGPGEVVVDAATADEHGIDIGDTVSVRSVQSESLRVVGLAGFGDRPGLPNTTVALTSLDTAQQLLDLGSSVSEVLVIAGEVPVSQLRDRIGDGLGAAYEVSSSQDTAAASAEAAKTKLSYLQLMLFALAGAALLVGGFLIANTFSIVISQRTRELAVLRAAGATGRQIVGSVLGEAAFVGVLASALGTVLGVAAAVGLRDLVGQFGVALPDGDVVVAPRTVAVACAVGVLVTLLSAAGPARRAARVAPVEAMRQAAVAATRVSRVRLLLGGAFAVLGTAAVVTVALGSGPVALVGVGAVLGLTGLTLLAPVLTPGLARLVGRPLRPTGVTGRLATESAARAPRRTAATAMALALSLALITFMTVVASSIKGSIADSYQEVISADYVVESARGEMLGGLSPEIYRGISGLPDVEVTSRLRYGHWKEGGATRALTAIDPETLPAVTSVRMVAGRLDDLGSGGIVLAEKIAEKQGLEIGDPFPMTFSRTGERRLPVVGLVADDDAQALMTDYLISLDTYARNFSEKVDASVFVEVADGVEPAAAEAAIESALAGQPTAELRDQAAAVAGRTATVDQILGLVTVLLLLAVLIAMLGITNTLALSIVERTREIGLLRAVGMTRAQLRWMVRGEAVVVAALSVVLGVGLGTAFGAAMVAVLGRNAEMTIELPTERLLAVVAIATIAGLVAGLLPARRAGRMEVLNAISAE